MKDEDVVKPPDATARQVRFELRYLLLHAAQLGAHDDGDWVLEERADVIHRDGGGR
jgi:hypothetical protein